MIEGELSEVRLKNKNERARFKSVSRTSTRHYSEAEPVSKSERERVIGTCAVGGTEVTLTHEDDDAMYGRCHCGCVWYFKFLRKVKRDKKVKPKKKKKKVVVKKKKVVVKNMNLNEKTNIQRLMKQIEERIGNGIIIRKTY